MKCTWVITGGKLCGKETGKPCPPQWKKHEVFSVIAIKCFFLGTENEQELFNLEPFCCSEHLPLWKKSLLTSFKLQNKKEPEYSI